MYATPFICVSRWRDGMTISQYPAFCLAGRRFEFVGRSILFLFLVVALFPWVGLAGEPQTYTFRQRYVEGQSYNCLYSISLNVDF